MGPAKQGAYFYSGSDLDSGNLRRYFLGSELTGHPFVQEFHQAYANRQQADRANLPARNLLTAAPQ